MSPDAHTIRHTAPTVGPVASPPGPADLHADAPALITLVFGWHRASRDGRRDAFDDLARSLPRDRRYLSSDELTDRFGPDGDEMEYTARLVREFAAANGLDVRSLDARSAVLTGSESSLASALGVRFASLDLGGGRARVHDEDVSLPAELARRVDHVLGAHTLPRSDRFGTAAAAVSDPDRTGGASPQFASGPTTEEEEEDTDDGRVHTELEDLEEVYEFPADPSGTDHGLRIGVISLGGGFHERDLAEYFDEHGVARPTITLIRQDTGEVQTEPVDGRWGDPAPADLIAAVLEDPSRAAGLSRDVVAQLKWTVEVTMDVQLIAGLCPGAEVVVYMASNDNQGEYWALSEAIHGAHSVPVVSCSWGSPEPPDHQHDRRLEVELLDSLLLDAGLVGCTVCVASGDSGDGRADADSPPRVMYPASSEFVLACGGSMFADQRLEGPELVWSEMLGAARMSSGGGFSSLFARPSWQDGVVRTVTTHPDRRGVPDVSAKADAGHGYCMIVGGKDIANGGTSAAAPVLAGLIARAAGSLGTRPGFLNSLLYSDGFARAFASVDTGSNGAWSASPGWDPCCGLGTPRWKTLRDALGGAGPKR